MDRATKEKGALSLGASLELPAKIVDLLHDFSNKMVKMEKNMQSQQSAPTNQKPFQPRRPFQPAKKPEVPKVPVPISGNNFVDYLFIQSLLQGM
jgi:hypothetical protein